MSSFDPLILSIDQGTTNTKVALFDRQGKVVAQASRSPDVVYPQPAWVEQDPSQIWQTVRFAINRCLRSAGAPKVSAIALTNQRETVVAWDRKSGQPLAPAIVWQCHRTAEFCQGLRSRNVEEILREKTGLTIDPMFSGSKMHWLLEHIADGQNRARKGEICLGTIDSWLLWNLTGGKVHACDVTNASRTQLMNLKTLHWDEELLQIFGIPLIALPEIRPSGSLYGETTRMGELPAGIPIASLIGDSHAALYGHTGFQPGSVKATYGTGSSLMTPTRALVHSKQGLSSTIAWMRGSSPFYALEGNIYTTGAAIRWFGKAFGIKNVDQKIESLARQAKDTGGVRFVPAFVGLGAPYWDENARGLITGITGGTNSAQLALAALESIAFQVRDVFEAMASETDLPFQVLMADGGACRNDLLMQIQSDLLGIPVVRNFSVDLSALGATYLAGLTVGIWNSEEELKQLPQDAQRFEPLISKSERDERYAGWKKAVRMVISGGK